MTAVVAVLVAMAVVSAGPEPAPPAPVPGAAPAPAAPAPWAELQWERAPDADRCISREELARETEGVLRRSAFSGDGPAIVRVRGGVGRDARGRWAATLALETPDGRSLGTRELTADGSDCRALDESLSVVLSLMVDIDKARLEIGARGPGPAAAPPPAAPPPALASPAPGPPAAVASVDAAAEAPAVQARWGWEVAAGATLGSGLLPGQALGGQAALALRPPRFPLFEIYGGVWTASALGGGFDVKMRALVLGAAVCPVRRASAWFEIEGCAGAEGGQSADRPLRFSLPEQTGPMAEVLAGPRLRARFGGGWQARLGVYAVMAVIRTRLVEVTGGAEQVIFQSSPISPRVALELAWGTTP